MRSLKRSEVLQECRRSITDFLQAERDFYGSEFPERLPMGGKIGPQTFGVRSPAASGTSSLPMAMPPIAPQSSELNLLNTIEEAMQGPGYTKLPTVGGTGFHTVPPNGHPMLVKALWCVRHASTAGFACD
jgi:hypothetical protein